MRVLFVHCAYRQKAGEDSVVASEAELLRSNGHEVTFLRRDNETIAGMSRVRLATDTVWSVGSAREASRRIHDFAPDVVHAHNTFPLISPSVFWAARRAGVASVMTLHNFRLYCPQGMLMRGGHVCEDCTGGFPWPALRHGCYRGSRSHTLALTAMLGLHRQLGTWQRVVTRYIALNAFCRDWFIKAGLPRDRVRVKPNFVDLPRGVPEPRDGFLFVGRLVSDKGVTTLARAAQGFEQVRLRVCGAGPEAGALEGHPNVCLLGQVDAATIYAEMRRAVALVLPSIAYENFPRTLVEAFACGLPVICSRVGPLPQLVADGVTGLLFDGTDGIDLRRKLQWAMEHRQQMAAMGEAARACYEAQYTAQRNHEQLMAIYRDAIEAMRAECTSR
jgi:glycosyltransferase involved in cell wall biosynthesis